MSRNRRRVRPGVEQKTRDRITRSHQWDPESKRAGWVCKRCGVHAIPSYTEPLRTVKGDRLVGYCNDEVVRQVMES